jgi:hypothetical protein
MPKNEFGKPENCGISRVIYKLTTAYGKIFKKTVAYSGQPLVARFLTGWGGGAFK